MHTGQMVIHRDIKPANIMVLPDGELKLLDFGIASTLNPITGEQTTITRIADRLMTPEYASPEQIAGRRLNATSDVYSLGVILYMALTGTFPHQFESRHSLEIIRQIHETPVISPSALPTGCHPTRDRFAPRLRGDLDTIGLKALAWEPQRRYAGVADLGNDLRRYLQGRPIQARPPTPSYRIRKFAGRHRWPLFLATGLAFFLFFFTIYAQQQRFRLARERDLGVARRSGMQRRSERFW